MSAKTTMETRKKTAQTIIPSRSLTPQRRFALPQHVEDVPESRSQSLHNTVAQPGFGHDFSQIRVHSDARAVEPRQSCPLASASPRFCPFGGACHTCPPRLQAKLAIGQSGDLYEQEADGVADQVTATPLPWLIVSPIIQRNSAEYDDGITDVVLTAEHSRPAISPLVQSQESTPAEEPEEEEEEPVTVQSTSLAGISSADNSLEQRVIQSKGRGQPLPEPTRKLMENRFGFDFGHVRVHTDVEASKMNDDLTSLAFTHGRDIYFAAGIYNPGTREGGKLLAHELTHVVQQSGGTGAGSACSLGVERIQRFEQKPYYRIKGITFHKGIEKRLRKENPALITEAPIPGGTSQSDQVYRGGENYFDIVGRADLYTSSNSSEGYVCGVQGSFSKEEQLHEEPGQRTRQYKNFRSSAIRTAAGAVKYQPTVKKNKDFNGTFPEWFKVADLKPFGATPIGGGIAQIGNYKEGFINFSEAAVRDGKISNPIGSGENLTGLKIPPELDYKNFETETSKPKPSEGAIILPTPLGARRYWIAEKGNLGLYLYFDMAHPAPSKEEKKKIDDTLVKLEPIKKELRKPDEGIDHNLNLQTQHRKERTKQDWPVLGAKWEADRKDWDTKYAKPLLKSKEAKFIEEKGEIDKALGLGGGVSFDSIKLAKELKSIELWSGFTGQILGKVRFLLGGTFDKLAGFFDRVKERFRGFHQKTRGIDSDRFSLPGPQKRLIRVILTAVKEALGALLIRLYHAFSRCIHSAIQKVIEAFSKEISEELTAEIQKVQELFEEFHTRIKTEFDERFGGYEELIKALRDVAKWGQIVSDAIAIIRVVVQTISCLSPPALGCLWGLAVNLGLGAMLDLVVGTKLFKEKVVNPIINGIIGDFIDEKYRQLITVVLRAVGLDQYEYFQTAACGLSTRSGGVPVGDVLPELRAEGLEGAALLEHRADWEEKYAAEMLKGFRDKFETAPGKPPTESEIAELLKALQESGLNGVELKHVLDSTPKTQNGKFDFWAAKRRLQRAAGGAGAGAERGAVRPDISITVGVPPPSGTRVEAGPQIFVPPITPGGEGGEPTVLPGIKVEF